MSLLYEVILYILKNTNRFFVNPLVPKIFVVEFFVKVLEKLPFYEKIPREKSYLDILNGNQDINDLRFLFF